MATVASKFQTTTGKELTSSVIVSKKLNRVSTVSSFPENNVSISKSGVCKICLLSSSIAAS